MTSEISEAYQPKLSIKAWAEEDRPREKLLNKGAKNLSDAELLAILLRSGSREESAVSLAQRVMHGCENNLNELGKQSLSVLTKFKGLGATKALTIMAAMELGQRRQLSDIKERPQVRSSKDAYQTIAPLLADLPHEEFWILLLNRSNRIISRDRVSMGGVSGTVVDARLVFKKALEVLASSVILCHNHPSGNLNPSQSDLNLTRKLKKAGEVMDVSVIDHLIIAEGGFYSFADEGVL